MKKKRYRMNFIQVMITMVIAAIVLVGVVSITIYALGYRYISEEIGGITYKYFGKTDEHNYPSDGKIYMSNSQTAIITLADNKIEYSNGDVYIGEISNFVPNGKGKLTYYSKETYEGDFKDGQLTGYGIYTYSEAIGELYEGEMENGKKSGKGKYTWADGSCYEGEFKDNKKDGIGTFIFADGSSYTGSFKEDYKNGEGVYKYTNGDTYEGNFENDVRSGNGKYVWSNGEYYVGEFKNNMLDGKGIYYWTSGRTYEGTFSENKMVR